MSYISYLVKIGSNTVPNNKIKQGTYTVAPLRSTIVDDVLTADGIRHITALDHQPTTVSFDIEMLPESDFYSVISYFTTSFTDAAAKILPVTYYDPWTGTYKTGNFHMQDIEIPTKVAMGGVVWFDNVSIVLEEL